MSRVIPCWNGKWCGFCKSVWILKRNHSYTTLPKSITTPVALQIASGLGGISSLTVVFVMLAGFTGAIFGPHLMKWVKIETTIGRGIGLGTGSHAIGTSKALELGEKEGSYKFHRYDTLCSRWFNNWSVYSLAIFFDRKEYY